MIAARGHSMQDLGQLDDDGCGLRLESFIAGAREHQGTRRQEMAQAVTPQFDVRGFPAAQWPGRGRKAGSHSKIVQQPVRVQFQQVFLVALHRLAKRSVEEAYLLEVESSRFQGNL